MTLLPMLEAVINVFKWKCVVSIFPHLKNAYIKTHIHINTYVCTIQIRWFLCTLRVSQSLKRELIESLTYDSLISYVDMFVTYLVELHTITVNKIKFQLQFLLYLHLGYSSGPITR